MANDVAIVWMRQDLRLTDNPALTAAAKNHTTIIPIYIYDETADWPVGGAQRWWLHHSLQALVESFIKKKITLGLYRGDPKKILPTLIERYNVDAIYWNRCYEPAAIKRDTQLKKQLAENYSIDVKSFNSSLLNEPWEITNKQGNFFKVFTPYWRTAVQQLSLRDVLAVPSMQQQLKLTSEKLTDWNLLPTNPNWASEFVNYWQVGEQAAQKKISQFVRQKLSSYSRGRDFPDQQGTSLMSPHLHFGEISPVQIWHAAQQAASATKNTAGLDVYLSEIGWREFSYHLLYHFPKLPKNNFRAEFDAFPWLKNKKHLRAWQQGLTGYPIVDAGMRELWQTGYMHNRIRMVVASFLTKHLLIDWRDGEQWFWDTLLDADLASNSASWQWVAGSGADAAPYFRIFNPTIQGEKFDPDGHYVRQWVPELANMPNKFIHHPWDASKEILKQAGITLGKDYPQPIVDHATARKRALATYQKIRKGD